MLVHGLLDAAETLPIPHWIHLVKVLKAKSYLVKVQKYWHQIMLSESSHYAECPLQSYLSCYWAFTNKLSPI